MEVTKTSEKVVLWMHRNGVKIQDIAKATKQTRQTVSAKLKDNTFSVGDIYWLKKLGYNGKI